MLSIFYEVPMILACIMEHRSQEQKVFYIEPETSS